MSLRAPGRVVVVGAGMVGLSCALALQDHGVEVQVLERSRTGAGASYGNAGYVSPSLAAPLPEPSVLRYGLRALLDPASPVALAWRSAGELAAPLARLARNCTSARWTRAMAVYRPLNEQAFEAYERQHAAGVDSAAVVADVLAGFAHPRHAAGLLHELLGVMGSGQRAAAELLDGEAARNEEPTLSRAVRMAVRVPAQRFIDPVAYVAALASTVTARGGTIVEGVEVSALERRHDRLLVRSRQGESRADVAVLANGAWLGPLARPHGVRIPVFAGRGYSCTVAAEPLPRGPLYFPRARVAATPMRGRLRLAGIMEFERPDAALDSRRIDAMVTAVRPLLEGVDWASRGDEWVGGRPLTSDGVPLVGATATEGVYVAGGHGMWGMTLGPLTGHLLAEGIVTGRTPPELVPLDPCR